MLPLTGFRDQELVIPAEDGNELYIFNPNGRHLYTIDTMTGTIKYSFEYNENGKLIGINDLDGNKTSIERDGTGNVSVIVGPYGQRTTLLINSDGYLANVSNPANETARLTYHDGGLLATMTDPKGNVHRYTYDELGRLTKDEDPAGGYTALERKETDNGYLVTSTTGKDATSTYVATYLTETLSTGETKQITEGCCGEPTETIISQDGSKKVNYPNGTVVTTV